MDTFKTLVSDDKLGFSAGFVGSELVMLTHHSSHFSVEQAFYFILLLALSNPSCKEVVWRQLDHFESLMDNTTSSYGGTQ